MDRKTFRRLQVVMPLLPIPLGCYFLYKAIVSFNRNPPPIATDSATVLSRPMYAEPIYKVRASPSAHMRTCASRRALTLAEHLLRAVRHLAQHDLAG